MEGRKGRITGTETGTQTFGLVEVMFANVRYLNRPILKLGMELRFDLSLEQSIGLIFRHISVFLGRRNRRQSANSRCGAPATCAGDRRRSLARPNPAVGW